MTLEIKLKPQTEARLRQQATKAGKAPAAYAEQVIEENLAVSSDASGPDASLPTLERVKAFMDWVARHRPVDHTVDDSRETIYGGRGE